MTERGVTGEARLRARNQLTLPEPVVHAAGMAATSFMKTW